MRALFITANGFEDLELFCPLYRLLEAGVEADVAASVIGPLRGKHGYEVRAGKTFSQARSSDYDLLILPGGLAPQTVRKDELALKLVREYHSQDKPLAAICHGPQILISAGLVAGRKMTAYYKVQPELAAAGAQVLDEPVVVEGRLITSRVLSDLPYFCREIMKAIGNPS
jgi:protease I